MPDGGAKIREITFCHFYKIALQYHQIDFLNQ